MTDPGKRTTGPGRTTLAAFFLFVTLAGGNVIAVRSVSCEDCELDPFWAAAMRFLLAALILAAFAVAGMAVIFREGLGAGVPLGSLLALLAAAACFAETGIVVKAFPPVHPVSMNAIGLGVGGLMLLILAMVYGESLAVPEFAKT